MRLRVITAATFVVVLGACGSGDGTRPPITATLPEGSIAVTAPPPGETQPPQTQPPETQPPETQPPETQPPAGTAAPTDTVAADDEGDDGTVWWPWVLAAIVIIGGIAAILARRRKGPAWATRTTALLDQVDQLTSHLAALPPDGLRAVAATDAMALATVRASLRDLIASAPDADKRAVLDRLSAPIAQLHGAVDSIALSGSPGAPPGAASVAQLAAYVHTASASVRADALTYR